MAVSAREARFDPRAYVPLDAPLPPTAQDRLVAAADPLDDLAPWIPDDPAIYDVWIDRTIAAQLPRPSGLITTPILPPRGERRQTPRRDRAITVIREALTHAADSDHGLGCVFTVDCVTGDHHTYRIARGKSQAGRGAPPLFASVLVGGAPDNPFAYKYIGIVGESLPDRLPLILTAKSQIRDERATDLQQALEAIATGQLPAGGTITGVANAGTCSRCGRLLTNPESLAQGIGPECREKA